MKKLLLVILLTAFSTSMFAGWSVNQRNKCRWWSKRFAANAHVFTGTYSYQHDAGCDWAYAEKIKECAWQKAYIGWDGAWQYGWVKNSFCSRGNIIKPLESLLLPKTKSSTDENIEESSFKYSKIVFNESSNSIEINGMSGFIKLQRDNGYFSNIRLSIWQPKDDLEKFIEDEIMDDSKVLNQFEVKVTDNGIFFNGDLVNDELKEQFLLTKINNELYVKFENVNLNVKIKSEISLDDLAVRIDGDGAPNTLENIAIATENTNLSIANNEFNLSMHPNPTSDIINIEFSNNTSEGTTIIELYDSMGEKVKDLYNDNLEIDQLKTIEVNISGLLNGKYFILIQSNGRKLIKQIIKN
jgi:hypothetical protein